MSEHLWNPELETAFLAACFDTMFDLVPEAAFVVTGDRRLLRINERARRMFGYDPAELADLSTEKLHVDREHYQEFGRRILPAIERGGVAELEFEMKRASGEVFPTWHRVTAQRGENGEVLGILSLVRDRSRQVRTEASLERHQRFLERAQAIGKIGTWELDLHTDELLFTDEAHRICGVPIGVPLTYEIFLSRVHSEDRAHAERAFRSAVAGEPYDIEHRMVVDGKVRWVRQQGVVDHDEHGQARRGIGVIQDITERKASEERQIQAQKLESLGLLAGGIAHDFNNLLTGILGNLSLARMDEPLGETAASLLEEAEEHVQRARGLATQLLTFSRGGEPHKELVDTSRLLRSAATFANRGSRSRLELDVPDALPAIRADQEMITQVVGNLVINANQAMPTGGSITVAGRVRPLEPGEAPDLPAGDYLELQVADEGGGVSPEHRSKIFDPYFSTKGAGRGLGLATSRSIVHRHGGAMDLSSRRGPGATFRILLPVAQGEAAPLPADSREVQVPAGLRVLVVDDEAGVRRLLGQMLGRLEAKVAVFEAGEPAVAAIIGANAAGRPFDLCILDLTLPGGIDGVETARRIREQAPDICLLLASGYADSDAIARPAEHGFDGVIRKPFSFDDLRRVIAACLGPNDETP